MFSFFLGLHYIKAPYGHLIAWDFLRVAPNILDSFVFLSIRIRTEILCISAHESGLLPHLMKAPFLLCLLLGSNIFILYLSSLRDFLLIAIIAVEQVSTFQIFKEI